MSLFPRVSVSVLGQGETGRAKLWRISHIKHVFRLFCLTPHCDVFYDVNMKNHKMRRCVQTFCSFLKCIFVFIRQMQWKLTGKWERDTGTAAHPAALNRRRRCVQTGTNKVFKSVPHLCPKETSMGVNKQKCPNEDTEDGTFLCWTRLFARHQEQICFSTWLISSPQKYFHHSVTFSKNL